MRKKQKIIIGIVLSLSTYALIHWFQEKSQLDEDYSTVIARVDDSYSAYRGGINIKFTYPVNNTQYKGETTVFVRNRYLDSFKNKYFLVVYQKTNPKNHQILIFPKDYEHFNLSFPDSLRWVENLRR